MKFVITSCDKKGAKKLSKKLIKRKFAACVSVIKAKSTYVWKSEICSEKERILLIKTAKKFKKISKFIKSNHSYELPEIALIKADGALKKYAKWVRKSTKGKK
ncbi:divalent cation tolerance protein CutA [Campylobacter sp. RM16188]|uniref:divalent cation tolerance protein CutA n=1 Tax=Campylobacter sp. RM16188 TaxID=1705725 RepID=UPI0015581633|nr:divalent cation tolerance protein CutA [Campylobacter sp. RM16188]